MEESKLAICTESDFGLVPANEVERIELEEAGAVRFQGENYNLFKAKTPEGSKEIEQLLSKYENHRTESHRIEPVIMSGAIEMTVPGFDRERDSVLLGGYCFECDGIEVPFDFSGSSGSIDQSGDEVSVSFETGSTPLGTDCFLDDCYEDAYAKAGLRMNDITAEFLSKADRIIEFAASIEVDGKDFGMEDVARMGKFEIKELVFSDGRTEHAMSRSALDAFNELHAPRNRGQERGALSELPISEAKARAEAHRGNRGDSARIQKNDPIL